jgi:hypothetical protein
VKAVFRTLYLLVNKEISAINLKVWGNESKQRREWARINFSSAKEQREAIAQRRKVKNASIIAKCTGGAEPGRVKCQEKLHFYQPWCYSRC